MNGLAAISDAITKAGNKAVRRIANNLAKRAD
jgi:hypothetical protein